MCVYIYIYIYLHNKYTQNTHIYYVNRNLYFVCDNRLIALFQVLYNKNGHQNLKVEGFSFGSYRFYFCILQCVISRLGLLKALNCLSS